MTVNDVICSTCNQSMGNGPDGDLAKSVEALRNYGNLKAGDGGDAPQIVGCKTKSGRFNLFPGGRPELNPENALKFTNGESGTIVSICASNEAHAERLAQGAARKLAKESGRNDKTSVADLYAQLISAKRSALMEPPDIQHNIELGSGGSQQAMAKAALVLWAKLVGNDEVLASRYDAIRRFIWQQNYVSGVEPPTKYDARPLPTLNEKYGSCPCIVLAGSDHEGKVFGYFRLYGMVGWRIDLGQSPTFTNKAICLISNPFDPSKWDPLEDEFLPINFEWVRREWDSYAEEHDGYLDGAARLMSELSDRSHYMFIDRLVREAVLESGLKAGQTISDKHISFISKYLADRLVKTAPEMIAHTNGFT